MPKNETARQELVRIPVPEVDRFGSVKIRLIQERRRGDRRHRLLWTAVVLATLYIALFVWPTPWRYDHVGRTAVRTHRVTDQVEFLNLQGWQPALPPLDVHRTRMPRVSKPAQPARPVSLSPTPKMEGAE